MSLEEIGNQAQKKFPMEHSIALEVDYRPISKDTRAEIIFGWDDQDYVLITVEKSGAILDDNDGFNPVTPKEVIEQLLGSIKELQKERIPGTMQKLEFLRKEISKIKL